MPCPALPLSDLPCCYLALSVSWVCPALSLSACYTGARNWELHNAAAEVEEMLSKVMERMDVMGFTEERKKVGGLVLEGLRTSQGLAVLPDLFGGSVQCTAGQVIRPSGHRSR